MPFGRIQKLLCDEYCQFGDTVLIESPFAETTRDGHGLEQVHLGITPTKLIIAADYLESLCGVKQPSWCGLDPEVETLELASLYPVEYVNLSVYRTSRRQSLKATFANNVTRYFELGGLEKRKMFWNLWCERVLQLSPHEAERGSSPPSSRTSPPRTAPRAPPPPRRKSRTRATVAWENLYRPRDDECLASTLVSTRRRWTEKNLYLGSKREKQDAIVPRPVPGLGATTEIKLLSVRPKQWHLADSSENLSRCCLRQESTYDFEVYTYTGEPTSNVTYTSITKDESSS